jgi:16S rRNA (cytidine1402-2'-O)-methyltransferase
MVFYESPHRLMKTLTQFQETMGENRNISVSRELTKKFEETVNGTIAEVIEHFNTHIIKGEFVIILEGGKG